MRKFLVLLAAILITPLFVHKVKADTHIDIQINEIMINPDGEDKGNEWVTLKNISEETVNTQSYYVLSEGRSVQVFDHCPIIQSNELCLVELEGLFFHNDFGEISLLADEEVIDQFIYDKSIDEDDLVLRINGELVLSSLVEELEEQELFDLIFTEIYPSPNSGEEEWLKIFNNLKSITKLTNITIRRDNCSSDLVAKFTDEYIQAEGYLVVDKTNLKKSLLNAGGTLVICNLDAELDKLIYPEIKKGESFYLKEGEWINTGNTIQEQEVNPLPNNDIEEDTSEQSSSNIVENTTVKSYLQNTSKTNVQGLSSSNTENLPVYILPSLEKIQNNLNNNQPIQLKSGVHVSGNLWVIFFSNYCFYINY